jgi:hypothetical protein
MFGGKQGIKFNFPGCLFDPSKSFLHFKEKAKLSKKKKKKVASPFLLNHCSVDGKRLKYGVRRLTLSKSLHPSRTFSLVLNLLFPLNSQSLSFSKL